MAADRAAADRERPEDTPRIRDSDAQDRIRRRTDCGARPPSGKLQSMAGAHGAPPQACRQTWLSQTGCFAPRCRAGLMGGSGWIDSDLAAEPEGFQPVAGGPADRRWTARFDADHFAITDALIFTCAALHAQACST